MTLQSFFCALEGYPVSKAIPVEIDSNKTIGILKKLIKVEAPNRLKHVDASSLELWKSIIPNGVEASSIYANGDELDARSKLSETILESEMAMKDFCILVRIPKDEGKSDVKFEL